VVTAIASRALRSLDIGGVGEIPAPLGVMRRVRGILLVERLYVIPDPSETGQGL
jgi:hypothetical protein